MPELPPPFKVVEKPSSEQQAVVNEYKKLEKLFIGKSIQDTLWNDFIEFRFYIKEYVFYENMPSVSTDKVKFQERHTLNANLTDEINNLHVALGSLKELNTSIEENINFLTKNYTLILEPKQLKFLINILKNIQSGYLTNEKRLQELVKNHKYKYLWLSHKKMTYPPPFSKKT